MQIHHKMESNLFVSLLLFGLLSSALGKFIEKKLSLDTYRTRLGFVIVESKILLRKEDSSSS